MNVTKIRPSWEEWTINALNLTDLILHRSSLNTGACHSDALISLCSYVQGGIPKPEKPVMNYKFENVTGLTFTPPDRTSRLDHRVPVSTMLTLSLTLSVKTVHTFLEKLSNHEQDVFSNSWCTVILYWYTTAATSDLCLCCRCQGGNLRKHGGSSMFGFYEFSSRTKRATIGKHLWSKRAS